MSISELDKQFVERKLLPYFGIKSLNLKYSDSKKKYPDIWVSLDKIPTITVTNEWKKQSMNERRKRLVHEALHVMGLEHGKYGKYIYSTFPRFDTYSKKVYQDILKLMG